MIDLMALLELYNTYSHDDIFYEIARNILSRYNELELNSLNDFADSLHVSPSSLNRFLKQLYYDNFTTFRQEHLKREEYCLFDHQRIPGRSASVGTLAEFSAAFVASVTEQLASVNQSALDALLHKLQKRESIIFVGIPMPSEVWWLQLELVLLGKRTCAFLDPNCQVEAIRNCVPGDLVVGIDIVRQDDIFFDGVLEIARERGAETVCISHVAKPGMAQRVDLALSYDGVNTRADQATLAVVLNYLGHALRGGATR